MTRTLTAKEARRAAGADKDYLKLVREVAVRPIKSDEEFREAQGVLDRLVGRPRLTPGQLDYVAALARFVEDYERERRASTLGKLPPLEVLKFLMTENEMSTSDLGEVLGSRGLASEVLNGKRGLSKMLIARLSRRFAVDPSLFLDVDSVSAAG